MSCAETAVPKPPLPAVQQHRRLLTSDPLEQLQQHPRMVPGVGHAGGQHAGVGVAGLHGSTIATIHNGNFRTVLAQKPGAGDAGQTAANDKDFHTISWMRARCAGHGEFPKHSML